MKWTYSIKNKMAASSVLFSLCLLVLFSNYIDRNHTKNVKNAISTLYEDRLIAVEYILKMTSSIYQLKELISDETNANNKINSNKNLFLKIRETNNAYQTTKFTEVEKRKAEAFLNILNELEAIPLNNTQKKLEFTNKALALLDELSTIQLEESKKIMANAEKLYISGKTSSQFVFALIIIILFILQTLLFASKTLTTTTKSPNLN